MSKLETIIQFIKVLIGLGVLYIGWRMWEILKTINA